MKIEKKSRMFKSYAYLCIKVDITDCYGYGKKPSLPYKVCGACIFSESEPTSYSTYRWIMLMMSGGKDYQEAKDKLVRKINNNSNSGLRNWIIELGLDENVL